MRRKRLIFIVLALIVIAGGIAYWRLTAAPSVSDADLANQSGGGRKSDGESETKEEKDRRMLVGTWQDEYRGKRTMTLNEDGTGVMVVELTGIQARLFASKLRFDMRWSLKESVLKKTTVSGEPADKVNLILNTMGNTAKDTIIELTENRLLLLDENGKTKYDWRRVELDQ